MSYEIPYSTDYTEWYGTPQNVTRLSAVLDQVVDEDGNNIGRITASWDVPDNGGTFNVLTSTDGETYTLAVVGLRNNSTVFDVEPNTDYYIKVITVLDSLQSEGTVSGLLIANVIPTPNAPVVISATDGLRIQVGIIPRDYTAYIAIDNGSYVAYIETSDFETLYYCEDGVYDISVAFMDVNGNIGTYSDSVSINHEEVYVRKTSHDYIKSAEVNGNTLTLTTGDGQMIVFQGGGGGGGFSPITQDGDTITVPSGHIDATMQQINLYLPNKTLVLR